MVKPQSGIELAYRPPSTYRPPAVKPDRFICGTCDQTFMFARQLVRHIREVREAELEGQDGDTTKAEPEPAGSEAAAEARTLLF